MILTFFMRVHRTQAAQLSRSKNRVHQIENCRGFLRPVDIRAQFRAIAHAVREVSRELFHLADRIGLLAARCSIA